VVLLPRSGANEATAVMNVLNELRKEAHEKCILYRQKTKVWIGGKSISIWEKDEGNCVSGVVLFLLFEFFVSCLFVFCVL